MNFNQLQSGLKSMGVKPQEIYRASLYYDRLLATQNFFNVVMAGAAATPNGLGNDYAFVQTAVRSSNLLQELADMLDKYIVPPVSTEMQVQLAANAALTYQGYFTTSILNNDDAQWRVNLAAFYARIPIAGSAMATITNNFQQNVLQACQRAIADRVTIGNFFGYQKYPGLVLSTLDKIKSSGSDFHKGGKQVLFLTFNSYFLDELDERVSHTFQIVYKPGDLEMDCLIAGNSAVINNLIPGFNNAGSLVEIFNAQVDAQMQADPKLGLVHLPTYRILPRNYMSGYVAAPPLPLNNAYGYIEYLNHDVKDTFVSFCGYYPFASSDYIIFSKKYSDQMAVIQPFYRMLGEWLALASTFSLMDMHAENVRVNSYQPMLIDLELSLTSVVNGVGDTALFGGIGGINASVLEGSKYNWAPQAPALDAANPPLVPSAAPPVFDRAFVTETFENRLYAGFPAKRLVKVNNFWLVRGYNTAMQTIKAGATANAFNNWLARTNNVSVRYLPFPTSEFRLTHDQIYIVRLRDEARYRTAIAAAIADQLSINVTNQFRAYRAGGLPNFLAYALPVTAAQYLNLDIPFFFTRIGSQDIYDSTGALVAIPAQVTVEDAGGNPQQVNTNIGRANFFPSVPTTSNVVNNQLNVLTQGAAGDARMALVRNSLFATLNINGTPRKVDQFF